MAKFSFTLSGGLGDFILGYLGSPGVHLHYLDIATGGDIECRMYTPDASSVDLLVGSPFFRNAVNFYEHVDGEYPPGLLENDIRFVQELGSLPRLQMPIYLSPEEEDALLSIRRPYAVLHPFASIPERSLSCAYEIEKLSQEVADISGLDVVVLGSEDFHYSSGKVRQVAGSTRLAVRLVQGSCFAVTTHSSMACAAWVYGVPCLTLGPSWILSQEFFSPGSAEKYLAPMFRRGNGFIGFDLAGHFEPLFARFLRQSTSLNPSSRLRPSRSRPSCFPYKLVRAGPAQMSGPAPA